MEMKHYDEILLFYETVLGSYNLYILKDPSILALFKGTFNAKDEAMDYYHKLKRREK